MYVHVHVYSQIHTHVHTCTHALTHTQSRHYRQSEQELRFTTRYEEGYDLYDEKYEAWLKLHHPEAVNVKPKSCTPADPVTPRTSLPKSASHLPSPSISTNMSPDQPSTSSTCATTPKAPSSTTSATPTSPSATPSPNTPKSTTGIRSPLSDLLNLPANTHGSKQSKTSKTGHARVLTSRECLQMLKEKEEKKK